MATTEEFIGNIKPIEIEKEMRSSFLDYAMSVIVSRALPDVRDGLKPVHRRILYGMYDMGILPNRPYKKCARMVGDVMGKYHPHGDSAIYDTLVRMAQTFSMRYPLIDGHGNFGSVDGDSPAAMRYTEARLAQLAMELLRDIDKDTVNFVLNYDGTEQEPSVLPARFPNLLVNGSGGIAVGMATNIPPHNLREVIDGVIHMIDNPEATAEELMEFVKGPDFPTGGVIMGREGIREAYLTGRGSIKVRGIARIEEARSGKHSIVVTELPYQVNKARLAEKIAELVREKRLTEITDLRDESDRSGMRLVIELRRDAVPNVALNKLYKHTTIESSFGVNMLALVDGVPRTLSLPEVIRPYITHQREIVVRRTRFDLAKAEARAHILEGLLIALSHLDEVIALIRGSRTVDEAHSGLVSRFALSAEQATAILEMRLQRLTGLEREKIEAEHGDLLEKIAYLKSILADENLIFGIIKEELSAIRDKFADERRTQITAAAADLDIEDLIAEEDMVITVTHSGYVKRIPVDTYRQQKRGGIGVSGLNLKDEDFVEHLFIASTHAYVLFFSNRGKVYKLKVHELPVGSRQARGQAIVNILPFIPGEKIAAVIATKTFEPGRCLMFATKKGLVKKTVFPAYNVSRRDGIIAINLREDDELISVKVTGEGDDVLMITRLGMSIRFDEADVRSMGRSATGVKGINLGDKDEIVGMDIAIPDGAVFVITEKGFGKRSTVARYPRQRRGGRGVRTIRTTPQRGWIEGARMVTRDQELMVISQEGIVIRVRVADIPSLGRDTQGVRVMTLRKADRVSALARILVSETGTEEEAE